MGGACKRRRPPITSKEGAGCRGILCALIAGKLADFRFAGNAMHSLLFNGGNGVLKWRPGG
jgi:hypothetical protein